jgi:hypothetical protein
MDKPLSLAATVSLIRRYAQSQSEATREQLAGMLGTAHTALANQGAVIYAFVQAARDARELSAEEFQAFDRLMISDYINEHLTDVIIWDHWNATLPQRVTTYTQYFGQVFTWLNEWPDMEEHIGLMQLGEDGPGTADLADALDRVAAALGASIKPRRHIAAGRPVNDEAIRWRLEGVTAWLQKWPEIEAVVYLLLPEISRTVLPAIGGLIATIPNHLDAVAELHRIRREMNITPPAA